MCGVCDMWIVISRSGVSRERNPPTYQKKKKERTKKGKNTGGRIIPHPILTPKSPPCAPVAPLISWHRCRRTPSALQRSLFPLPAPIQVRSPPLRSTRYSSGRTAAEDLICEGRPVSITPQPPLLHYKGPGRQGLAVGMGDNGTEVVLKSQRTTAAQVISGWDPYWGR